MNYRLQVILNLLLRRIVKRLNALVRQHVISVLKRAIVVRKWEIGEVSLVPGYVEIGTKLEDEIRHYLRVVLITSGHVDNKQNIHY